MIQIFLILFLCGLFLVILAWNRGRGVSNKHYTRFSYLSLGLPVMLILLMYMIPNDHSIVIYLLPIGSPTAFILSVYTLFKRNEKNTLAVIGLFLSLLLLGIVIIFGVFLMTPTSP
ncbi:hypothetical protein [Halobacillus litoralis]|uniref:hypothetical protein n=1 Tax=Halobacillus litoralis TaxID=45668 RepID=UPI001CFC67D9|nr:hypothetical protein [Halobacillus litoralis]